MAKKAPAILVVASERRERAGILSLLRGVGFAVAAATAERAPHMALCEQFAAAVVALPGQRGVELLRTLRQRRCGIPVLVGLDPDAASPSGRECAAFIKRPLDPHQLLGNLFELVLSDVEENAKVPGENAAEYGITAAKLSCLYRRLVAATSDGAEVLADDLSRQIDEAAMRKAAFAKRAAAI